MQHPPPAANLFAISRRSTRLNSKHRSERAADTRWFDLDVCQPVRGQLRARLRKALTDGTLREKPVREGVLFSHTRPTNVTATLAHSLLYSSSTHQLSDLT